MCGIAGFVNFDGQPASSVTIKQMTNAIAHRGPDGEGQFVHGNVGLGHRRLSIIDTSSAGAQPMTSVDESKVLSYNGELYNYKQLKSELEAKGYVFKSKTDTEVVLNALICWGEEALLKFNGMFALAFFDRSKQTILLARDRFGIKPLYICENGKSLWFGSEQKAITCLPDFKASINNEALVEYLTFQNLFTDKTLLKNISVLPAGHWLKLDVWGNSRQLRCFWDFHFQEDHNLKNRVDCEEELQRLFEQAVQRQMVADVEVGAYLSGGVDSGSITAIASKNTPFIKNFTIGFDLSSASGMELQFDERVKAEALSAKYRTEHYQMVLKAGDMERCLSELAWHLEEPRVGQCYPNYYAAKLASKFVSVVLSGTGGDELFGGYPWRYYKGAGSHSFEDYVDDYYIYWQRLMSNSELKQALAPVWSDVKHVWTRDIFRDVFKRHENQLKRPEDFVNHSLYFEAKTFLHGLLVVEDKLSMAHGLESRVPFLDNDLVDFAQKCPVRFKLNNFNEKYRIDENVSGMKQRVYMQKTNDGKQIFRDALGKYLGQDTSAAEKQGSPLQMLVGSGERV